MDNIKVLDQVNRIILGKEEVVKEVYLAILANGHILLEDIPGVGKTTLAIAFAKSLDLKYKRVQFTPDVLPSDLTGFYVYNKESGEFTFKKGSVFCNLLLADEINRTSPKTQSALLEVMEEHQVTVEGVTYDISNPFIVIATQNPFGSFGTQPLPDTQMDRFLISLNIGYPDFDSEFKIAKEVTIGSRVDNIEQLMSLDDILNIQNKISEIHIDDKIYSYIVELIRATRENKYIEIGASTRAIIALVKLAKASAWLNGRDYVVPDDIKSQFKYVVRHRIYLNQSAKLNGQSKDTILDSIIGSVKSPRN